MTNNIINKKSKYKQVKKYLKELSDAGLIKYTDSEDGEGVSIQLMNPPTLENMIARARNYPPRQQAMVLLEVGKIELSEGDKKKSDEYIKEALELDPTLDVSTDYRGEIMAYTDEEENDWRNQKIHYRNLRLR